MKNYSLKDGNFIINGFEKRPAFSSFLPGLVGEDGIPMWLFYTNRGQAIGSLGINSKNNAIMEFFSANAEYENTEIKGFRTFIRANGSCYEPFRYDGDAKRTMTVRRNSFEIAEEAPEYGLKITVNYYILPRENVGALVRSVELENISSDNVSTELIDGVAKIIPNGISNGQFKEMSNLFQSWTDVSNLENNAPFFVMRASTDDSAEVEDIKGGYFYATVMNGELQSVIVDAAEVFGYDNSLSHARTFEAKPFGELETGKKIYNKVPCAFTPVKVELKPGASVCWTSYLGFAASMEQLNEKTKAFTSPSYDSVRFRMAEDIVNSLTADVKTTTGNPVFDEYIESSYMDNFLRGGYPTLAGDKKNPGVLYLYSRKHGDPERDYNWFTIDGEYYSQGNGNFRDVCQNRRSDVFFCPGLGDYNIKYFFSLIQTDGYNPLEIRPATFTLREGKERAALSVIRKSISGKLSKQAAEVVETLLKGRFKPGEIFRKLNENGIELKAKPKEVVERVLSLCDENIEAGASEGYWSDHWDYLMDLVDNYRMIFPERMTELVFGKPEYRYYDSDSVVKERSETYLMDAKGIWQYGSMGHDDKKTAQDGFVPGATNWKKYADGSIVEVTLAAKLLTLVLNKFSSLDSYGMGVEMEGGKPGWNDAMNGLPAMFGSSMPEAFELARMTEFLEEMTAHRDAPATIKVPCEMADYLEKVMGLVKEHPLPDAADRKLKSNAGSADFNYWEAMCSVREAYRRSTNYALSGEIVELSTSAVNVFAAAVLRRLEAGAEKAKLLMGGKVPTYFTFDAVNYEVFKDANGNERIDANGRKHVKVLGFRALTMPMFLEGPARYLNKGAKDAADVHKKVLQSGLYDKKLKMFKTSESIEKLGMKYGRIRAFTPGWLERESVFLHMEYKYLVSLQRSGLYREYFEAAKNAFIPYLDPEVYGRSTLENSSFIASSANPDERVHGRGYVARLSGSTTEIITMWIRMFLGEEGFYTGGNNELKLSLRPVLPADMFNENGIASWTFMGCCRIVYHNETGKATFGRGAAKVRSMRLMTTGGEYIDVKGDTLSGELALGMREGRFVRVDAEMK